MSKIGKKEIIIPSDVTVTLDPGTITVSGKRGKVSIHRLDGLTISNNNGVVTVERPERSPNKKINAFWGTQQSILAGAVKGVQEGYEKKLELEGVGYKAIMEGKTLVLSLGLSHTVRVEPPEGIDIVVVKNSMTISGVDKALVGQVAANIRAFKKPEPYKGKGIRYAGEIIRRKSGKKMAGSA
ncbi:MAG: 50S ribosomal protein L6 [Parcubacteria group bacterium]|nr:50S ribosomal protein L6 [Parcubacteria group bacterium]